MERLSAPHLCWRHLTTRCMVSSLPSGEWGQWYSPMWAVVRDVKGWLWRRGGWEERHAGSTGVHHCLSLGAWNAANYKESAHLSTPKLARRWLYLCHSTNPSVSVQEYCQIPILTWKMTAVPSPMALTLEPCWCCWSLVIDAQGCRQHMPDTKSLVVIIDGVAINTLAGDCCCCHLNNAGDGGVDPHCQC